LYNDIVCSIIIWYAFSIFMGMDRYCTVMLAFEASCGVIITPPNYNSKTLKHSLFLVAQHMDLRIESGQLVPISQSTPLLRPGNGMEMGMMLIPRRPWC
jgi:hypothetical protein